MRSTEGLPATSQPTLVLLAYYYPPLAGVASERASALRRHLPGQGWNPVVITARNGFYHRTATETVDDESVVRTPNPEPSRILRRLYRGQLRGDDPAVITPTATGKAGSRARRFVREWLYVPDAQAAWIPFATGAALRAFAANNRAVIYSTSVPFSAHVAALLAARRRGRPWIAEFRDPWSASSSPARLRTRGRQAVDRWLEGLVVKRADHLVVTSHATKADFLKTHPWLDPDRISVLTNGFEPAAERRPPPAQSPMTLLYAGTVAPGEDVGSVMQGFDEVHDAHPGSFRLRILGPPGPWLESGARRSWLECAGVVSPAQAREAMAESSALLLIQGHPAYRNILPGKLFEYIGARRPIVALCPRGTEMAELLAEHADARFVSPGGGRELTAVMDQLLTEHSAGELQVPRVPLSVTEPLRFETQFARLAQLLDHVLER